MGELSDLEDRIEIERELKTPEKQVCFRHGRETKRKIRKNLQPRQEGGTLRHRGW